MSNPRAFDDPCGPPTLTWRLLADAPPSSPDWLWPGRIPIGCLTLLIGDPAVGKSLLAADLAARLSVPQTWPDDPPAERPDPATLRLPSNATNADFERLPRIRGFLASRILPSAAVFAAPEDHAALPARLAAAGADPIYVSLIDGVRPPFTQDLLPFHLPTHLPQLQQAIRAHDHPRLVVLDPLHALLDDGIYTSPNHQARLLGALAATARGYAVAILALGHFAKTASRRVFYRVRGSISLVASARSVLLLTADPNAPDRRILTHVKNAYGPLAAPLAFHILDGPRLEWDAPETTDWRLGTGDLDLSPESFYVISETCNWLADFLAGGPRPALDVHTAARALGVSRTTLYRAKRLLNIRSHKLGEAWAWLPDEIPGNVRKSGSQKPGHLGHLP